MTLVNACLHPSLHLHHHLLTGMRFVHGYDEVYELVLLLQTAFPSKHPSV